MIDMTTGKPIKKIILFAIPLLIGNLFQQFYNMADMIVVGNVIGADALAAIGSTAPLYGLFISLIYGITSGFSIVISKYVGAKDEKNLRKSVAHSFIFMIMFSIIFTALIFYYMSDILTILRIPSEIYDNAYAYIKIVLAGIVITFLYNTLAGLLRGIGNSKVPLVLVILSSLLNVALDYLFIAAFDMGIKGAAYATVISQVFSSVLCFIYIIFKCPMLKVSKNDFILEGRIVRELMSAGASMGFMFSIVSVGTLSLQTSINELGAKVVAAHTTARKVDEFLMGIGLAFSATMTTFSAQNQGAGKSERIYQGLKSTLILLIGYSIFATIIVYLFGSSIITLFSGVTDLEIVDIAVSYLRFNVPFFPVLKLLVITRSTLQGMGYSVVPVCASIFELVGKIAAARILVRSFGYIGAIVCEPITWVVGATIVSVFLLIVKTKEANKKETLYDA